MKVVCNASPLINLARIGQLALLQKSWNELIIPQAVWHEVVVAGAGLSGATEINAASWIKTQSVTNRSLVRALQQELDAGEAEAIVLAMETGADLLLMDESLGRETAHHLGLHYTGIIGILIRAKRKSIIETVKPYLDQLRDIAGFRISEALYRQILADEKEL